MRSLLRMGMCAAILGVTAAESRAALVLINQNGFPPGTTMVNLTSANGQNVQGLSIQGVTFSYSSTGGFSPSAVIDGGPGLTNHITPPNVVSVDNNPTTTDTLTMTFARPQSFLGYGFALLDGVTLSTGSTVTLFDASNQLLGSVSVGASPDPTFTGGFLGVASTTTPFARAVVTFGDANATAFALGNLEYALAVPEPSSLVLSGIGVVAGLGLARRRRIGLAP